jgi:hypothetical protein
MSEYRPEKQTKEGLFVGLVVENVKPAPKRSTTTTKKE